MSWRKRPELERKGGREGGSKAMRAMQVLAIGVQPEWHRCPRRECLRERRCMAPRACEAKGSV